MKGFICLLTFICLLAASPVYAQPCKGSGNADTLPVKCLEIESILVNACTSSEGFDEMVRLRLGPSPLTLSSISNVDWATNNPWQGWATWSTTNLNKLVTINNMISTAGSCGRVIKLNPSDVIPAYGRVLIITSIVFNATAHDFSGLTDTLYVALQNNNTVTTGHFANTTTNTLRTFIIGTAGCSDTVYHYGDKMIKADGTSGSEDGSGVSFTHNGAATYFNYGCALPVKPLAVDAGIAYPNYCSGDGVILNGAMSGGYCYNWYPADRSTGAFTDSTLLQTTFRIKAGYTGMVKLYLIAYGSCHSKLDSVSFNVVLPNPPIHITAFTDTVWCNKNLISLELTTSGANPIVWSTTGVGAFFNASSIHPSYLPATGETGEIWFKVNQGSVCNNERDSIRLILTAPPSAKVTPEDTVFCFGVTPGIQLTPLRNGGVYSDLNVVNDYFTPPAVGIYKIQYRVELGGCADSSVIQIEVLPKPNASFRVSDSAFCLGTTSVTLTPLESGGLFLGVPVTGNNFAPSVEGVYRIRYIIDNGGCMDSSAHVVTVGNKPDVQFSISDTLLCRDDPPAQLVPAKAGGVFSGFAVSGTTVKPDIVGVYEVKYVANNLGCKDSAVQRLRVAPEPTAFFTMNPETSWVAQPVNYTYTGSGGEQFYWLFGDGASSAQPDPVHIYSDDNFYEVLLVAVSIDGCVDSSKQVLMIRAEERLFIPNVFTANHDGVNDQYGVVHSGVHHFDLHIFDRWGELMFQADDPDVKWDGTFKGTKCPEGVYFYLIEYRTLEGKLRNFTGTITLLR